MAAETPGPALTPERLFAWSVLAFAGAALLLLLSGPAVLMGGGERGELSGLVHLLTLGGLVGSFHALQPGVWRILYGREPFWPPLVWLVLALHVAGVVLLAWGFSHGATGIAHLGGHYLVPTAIVLAVGQGAATAVARRAGQPLHLAAHLPGLGLLVTMALGAMLVLDAHTGRYDIYTPETILIHMASGGFLFFLPMLLLHQGLEDPGGATRTGPLSSTALLLLPAGLGAAGVLALSLTQTGAAHPALLPVGLLLLGAVALWIGLPAFGPRRRNSLKAVRRSVWGALGLLLLFTAIRAWRGTDPTEAYGLMRAAVALFLFVVALPEVLNRIAASFPPRGRPAPPPGAPPLLDTRAQALHYVLLLLGAGIILAGQVAGSANLMRAGGLLWALCLGWQAGWLVGAVGRGGRRAGR